MTSIWISIIAGAGLGVFASISPGALQAYLLQQTIQHGWRRALPAVFAPLLSDIAIILLVLFILSRFSASWLRIIQAVGGCFLLYLALEAYRTLRKRSLLAPPIPPAAPQTFLKAVMANGLTPGPYFFWSVIAGPLLLRIWAVSPAEGIGFLLVYYLALIGVYAMQVFCFATVGRIGPRTAFGLRIFAASALLLMGLYQIWSGLTGA